MAYGELSLKPSEFRLLTPVEFFALHDGHRRRISDQEEREAKWVAMLMNASGHMSSPVTTEMALGRPLRVTVETAKGKQGARLAEKDAERRNMNIREI